MEERGPRINPQSRSDYFVGTNLLIHHGDCDGVKLNRCSLLPWIFSCMLLHASSNFEIRALVCTVLLSERRKEELRAPPAKNKVKSTRCKQRSLHKKLGIIA